MSGQKAQWASRWGFVMASLGMAIGAGNIWRFPREVAQNGGGPFLIAWTIAMLIFAVPVIMGELVIGRKTRRGTIGAFRDFLGKKYTWMGTWVGIVCIAIMFYYSVITGWCLKYLTLALSGTFKSGMTTEATQAIWDAFTTTPSQTILFHAIAMCIAGFIVIRGVNAGIEKACKVMIPTLFGLLILAGIRALTLPGAEKGLEFLFSPKLYMLSNPTIWMEAFVQAAWSTGAGWGLVLTYAVYTKQKEDVAGNALTIGVGDNIGALTAGLVVLPTIFALAPNIEYATQMANTGGTGLTFVALAQLFSTIPAGNMLAAAFFFTMGLAALSSLLPMIEVGILNIMDMGVDRKKASIIVLIVGFLGGIPSAYSLSIYNNQDNVTGFALFISCLFFVYALVKYGVEKVRTEEINTPWTDFNVGKWFNACIFLAPVVFIILWYQYLPGLLEDPNKWTFFTEYSLGTIFGQFTLYIVIGLLTMNYFNKKIEKGPMTREEEGVKCQQNQSL